MAHYKRKRSRTSVGSHTSTTFYRKRLGLKPAYLGRDWWKSDIPASVLWPAEFNMMSNWPRWWDIIHHTRPTRRKAKQITRSVLLGKLDPDNAVWPKHRDKHCYYW
jgi:hypothetical protein